MNQKNSISKVSVIPVQNLLKGEFSDKIFRKCSFCDKDILLTKTNIGLIERLSGPNGVYCPFCLKHGFYTKNNKHILILSFRAIIGHLYYQNYLIENKIWLSELEDIIDCHVKTGLKNPLFFYDAETYLWFLDFSRIGTSKKKLPILEVHKTICEILLCFNFWDFCPSHQIACYQKFKDAINKFYEKRYRPDDRKMLIPSLNVPHAKVAVEKLRNFTNFELSLKK